MKNLINALIKFQSEIETINKTATGMHGAKYSPLPDVMKAVLPVLNKNDLCITQIPTHIDGEPALKTILFHNSGESIEDVMPLILPKNDPQGQGSSITYARRYSLASILGLVIDEDDDADSVSQSMASKTSSRTNKATIKQKNLILDLYNKKYPDQGEIKKYIKEKWDIDSDTMTTKEASKIIEELK